MPNPTSIVTDKAPSSTKQATKSKPGRPPTPASSKTGEWNPIARHHLIVLKPHYLNRLCTKASNPAGAASKSKSKNGIVPFLNKCTQATHSTSRNVITAVNERDATPERKYYVVSLPPDYNTTFNMQRLSPTRRLRLPKNVSKSRSIIPIRSMVELTGTD